MDNIYKIKTANDDVDGFGQCVFFLLRFNGRTGPKMRKYFVSLNILDTFKLNCHVKFQNNRVNMYFDILISLFI